MNNDELIEKLHADLESANKAKYAYDNFLESFIANKKKIVYDNFCNAQMDAEVLLEAKRLYKVIELTESEIKSIIVSGDFAKQRLQSIERESK